MAKKLSLKQKLHFGSKKQRASAKAALKRKRTIKRKNPAKRKVKRVVRARKASVKSHAKKNSARRRSYTAKPKRKRRAKAKTATRRNLGEIFSLTMNPARKKGHKMAAQKRKRMASAHRRNPGHRTKKKYMTKRRHAQRNPGMLGNPKEWLSGGAGVLVGVVGTRGLPQMILGASNTGIMGYAANAAAVVLLTMVSHMFMKGNKVFSGGVLAGGVASIISRVISDYSLLGSYSSQLGLGDYMVSNWVTPQRLTDGLHSAQIENGYNPPMLVGQGSAAGAAAGTGMGSYDSLY